MVQSYFMYQRPEVEGGWLSIPMLPIHWEHWRLLEGYVSYHSDVPRAEYLHFKEQPEWAEQCEKLCWYEVVGYDAPEQEWHDHEDCPLHGSVPYLNLLDLVAAEAGIDSKDGIELGGG